MKKRSVYLAVLLMIYISINHVFAEKTSEIDINFGWRFAKGEIEGAFHKDFDDTDWREVDVPHDWSIEDLGQLSRPFDESAQGQFDVGYVHGGTAWYRYRIDISEEYEGSIIHLQFGGVYMNADVWINGYRVGSRAYGYSTFWFDITPYIEFGMENVIAVEVKNRGNNSRWYSGSGIYRPVKMRIMEKIHISHWGTAVRTSLISSSTAEIQINTKIVNRSDRESQTKLISVIKDEQDRIYDKQEDNLTIGKKSDVKISGLLYVEEPELWSPDSPHLYTLVQNIEVAGEIVDHQETVFGIRTIAYNPEEGFLLNGNPVLLKGSCMHHDNYMLGSAAYPRAEERRVELTKAAGYNAIRCAHNPPSQAFLDACDRIGILVIDEAFDQWGINKSDHDQDYGRHFQEWWRKDIESMVLRDRNHPSIIMWSIGNEIPEQDHQYGVFWLKSLKEYVNNLDPSRPITMGVNRSGSKMDAFFRELDIVGYNYRIATYQSDQQRVPDRISYGSESFSGDAFEYWEKVEKLPYIIGDFVWTGWDYLGEASIGWNGYSPNWDRLGSYPWNAAYCGEIDLTGDKRPAAYYRDVLWKTGRNKVSVFVESPKPSLLPLPDSTWNLQWSYPDIHPSWTWPGYEGQKMNVVVYSACEEVELFLNGKTAGRKKTSVNTEYKQSWRIPYEQGELKAVGYVNNEIESEWILQTADKPERIKLFPDRKKIKANGNDLSYITAELFDQRGNSVYDWNEDLLIKFEVEGPGRIVGVGNSDPTSTESFKKSQRKTFRGRCVAVVKSTREAGSIVIKAMAEGLKSPQVKIITEK